MNEAYIWSVRKEWGKEAFENIGSDKQYNDYAYNVKRKPRVGDIIVFYSNKELLGSVPVISGFRPTTFEDFKNHPSWTRKWKYIMGLDGKHKHVFSPPVKVEDVADNIAKLKGKLNLHNSCRFPLIITINEYNLIKQKANRHLLYPSRKIKS
jgi:hypothetical protein